MEEYKYPIDYTVGYPNINKSKNFEENKKILLNAFKGKGSKHIHYGLYWITRFLITRIHSKIPFWIRNSILRKINMLNWIPNSPCQNNDELETWNYSYTVTRLQLYDGRRWISYKECTVNEFSINDEVMWVVVSPDNRQTSCYTGKVEFIGKQTGENRENVTIACVLFNQNTSHLPGFIAPESGCFKHIVDVKDLKNLHASANIHQPRLQLKNSELIDENTLSNEFAKLSLQQAAACINVNAWERRFDLNELRSRLKLENVQPFGIQGKNNSCYMDASLFCLFGFNHALDKHMRLETESIQEYPHIFKTVLKEIIKRLRTQFSVEYSEITKLRELLAESYDTRFRNSFMDAEEFILTLFEAIKMQHLFEYDDGYSDYIHQIVLPKDWTVRNRVEHQTVQALVQNSFKASGVKLKRKPDRLFIIKLPISNGELIPCKYIIPDLKLDLTTILSEDSFDIQSPNTVNLSAVICFRHSHYVAFARTNQSESSSWEFMDSNPLTGNPNVVILDHMDTILKELQNQHYQVQNCNLKHIPQIEKEYANRLLCDAYICIYGTSNQ